MANAPGDVSPLDVDDLAAGFAASFRASPGGLVLAVSGGPDSVCLMHLTARLAARTTLPPITVATVDHGLRPASSAEADGVMRDAALLGLPARRLAWTGPKPTAALQEKARAARYALLVETCRAVGADHLVTAHTRDDQAETVLFRLLRGSGPAGLAGMRRTTDLGHGVTQARPLLRVEKTRLIATCTQHGWSYATDPSNIDPRFARPKLRRLMPQLAVQGLDNGALERLADRAARAEDALAQAVEVLARDTIHAGPEGVTLDLRRAAPLPPELVIRLVGRVVGTIGDDRPIRLDRLERAATALRSAALAQTPLALTLHGTALRLSPDGRLVVQPEGRRRRGLLSGGGAEPHVKHNDGASLGKGGSGPYIGA
jgi:tRNA(Ile)-lysidine synthase